MTPIESLPRRIATEPAANALAAKVFPHHAAALAEFEARRPDAALPLYALAIEMQRDLFNVLRWLLSRPTIAPEAQFELAYELSARFTQLSQENGRECLRLCQRELAAAKSTSTSTPTA